MTTLVDRTRVQALAAGLVEFLQTGELPDGLFAADVFLDLTLPTWRLQSRGVAELVDVRITSHPAHGTVVVSRLDPTDTGFVLEFQEHWESEGQSWYCRELVRADVVDGVVGAIAVYCTGDWDEARQREHAATVTLLRRS
ncbi:MAG TPA: hypothetical protein VFW65_20795 [Pseudonocardiaceae bacterium]|nr:hypothetical protein [Pseudonocardiaceae bacterium]